MQCQLLVSSIARSSLSLCVSVCVCSALCNGSMRVYVFLCVKEKKPLFHRTKRFTGCIKHAELITQCRTSMTYTVERRRELFCWTKKPSVHLCAQDICSQYIQYMCRQYIHTQIQVVNDRRTHESNPTQEYHGERKLVGICICMCALYNMLKSGNSLRVCASLVCCLRISFIVFVYLSRESVAFIPILQRRQSTNSFPSSVYTTTRMN